MRLGIDGSPCHKISKLQNKYYEQKLPQDIPLSDCMYLCVHILRQGGQIFKGAEHPVLTVSRSTFEKQAGSF